MTESSAQPIPVRQRSSSFGASNLATSPTLSASQRFATLSLSPPTTLESDAFKQAMEHARSLSISAGSGPASRASSDTSDDPLITPPSTSPRLAQRSLSMGSNNNNSAGAPKSLPVSKAAMMIPEQDTEEELDEDDDDDLYARGARWGFPTVKSSQQPPPHIRRASIGTGVPSMAPLSRVASAGASSKPATEGFGLFRRFSMGASRPKAPSPPNEPMTQPTQPAPPTADKTQAVGNKDKDDKPTRGRGLFGSSSSTGTKPKRKISPTGERMLSIGGFGH